MIKRPENFEDILKLQKHLDESIHSSRERTLEGYMKASFGDYIIKGVKGEFYPCKPDIFQATYEEVR